MEKSPEFTYLLITTLIGLGGSVIAYLVKQNAALGKRIDDTNRETIETLKATSKQGEKVPELIEQINQQASALRNIEAENTQLRQRINDLDRRRT